MPIMKDKPRDDADDLEFTQGRELPEDKPFTFFSLERDDGKTVDGAFYDDDDVTVEYGSDPYISTPIDYSKLDGVLPNFVADLERIELERDKLKDRYTDAWNRGDMVSYLALESKWHELGGFIRGLGVLKDVLRHFAEYEWGEMDISSYYLQYDALTPQHRQAAQKKFDTLTSRAIQILRRRQDDGSDPS